MNLTDKERHRRSVWMCRKNADRNFQAKASAGRRITARHKRRVPIEKEAEYRAIAFKCGRKGLSADEARQIVLGTKVGPGKHYRHAFHEAGNGR